jgi:hypothetical protein
MVREQFTTAERMSDWAKATSSRSQDGRPGAVRLFCRPVFHYIVAKLTLSRLSKYTKPQPPSTASISMHLIFLTNSELVL